MPMFFIRLANWLAVLAVVCAVLALLVQAVAKLLFRWKPSFPRTFLALVGANVFVVIFNVDFLMGVLRIGPDLPHWVRGWLSMCIGLCMAAFIISLAREFEGRRVEGFLKSAVAAAVGAILPILALFVIIESLRGSFA